MVGKLIEWLNRWINEERYKAELAEEEKNIQEMQRISPSMGILLVAAIRIQQNDGAPFQAETYAGLFKYQGRTQGEALALDIRTTEALLPKADVFNPLIKITYKYERQWLSPLQPAAVQAALPAEAAPWVKRLSLVKDALRQSNYQRAFEVLNESSMFEMLRALNGMEHSDLLFLYGKLSQTAGSFSRDALAAAFGAVLGRPEMQHDFEVYATKYRRELESLTKAQRDDIVQFYTTGASSTKQALVAGRWKVAIGQSVWKYQFFDRGYVRWVDDKDPDVKGEGNWEWNDTHVSITWTKSTTRETWRPLPIRPGDQKGTCWRDGKAYTLSAVRGAS